MASTLTLDLRPGSGLGMFEIGMPLWTVIDLLRQHTTLFPRVDIKFGDGVELASGAAADAPVLLHAPPHLDLLFSPREQRLAVLALRRLREPAPPVCVTYRDVVISSTGNQHQQTRGEGPQGDSAPDVDVDTARQSTAAASSREDGALAIGGDVILRRADVSRHFGPTYPSEGLAYPGVSFLFDEDGPSSTSSTAGGALGPGKQQQGAAVDKKERYREVKRIVVMQAAEDSVGGDDKRSMPDPLGEVRECAAMTGGLRRAILRVHDGVILHFYPSMSKPVHVQLGYTTAQDLTVELGPPLRVYYKEDDRMAIHSRAKSTDCIENDGYFYNYVQHGIDFFMSGSSHIVQKVILHTNIPGTPEFQKYHRCPWEIEGEPEDEEDDTPPRVKFSDKLDVISRFLNRGSREQLPSMQVDRTEDERLTLPSTTTRLVGFDGLVLEATESALVVSVTLF